MITEEQQQFKKELGALLTKYTAMLGIRDQFDPLIVATFYDGEITSIVLGDSFDESDV